MATKYNKQTIQEMQEGEKDFGVLDTVKSIHKKVLSNDLVSEFDVFSVPVKLTLKGSEVYQSFCGGCIHLLLLAGCIALTILILFPNGIELQSEIIVTTVPTTNQEDVSQTLFDHTDEIMSWRGIQKSWSNTIVGYTDISNYSTFKLYMYDTNNQSTELEISTDCRAEGAEFCLKNTPANAGASIFGNFYDPESYAQYLVFEQFWCDSWFDPDCPYAFTYAIEIKFNNFLKRKGGKMQEVSTRMIANILNRQYTINVTKEIFTSNTKFFGHLSNLMPFSKYTYLFNDFVESFDLFETDLVTPLPNNTYDYTQVKITPYGVTREINENFDDVSDILLFFLSVKETFYILIFFLFVKHYNRNSGLLEVAESLFYIDDPKTKKKYDFKTGYQVFFACILYNHPFYNLINFILTKLGSTFEEALPNKAICAIKLMKKTEEILQENSFYGNLNELSSMESEAARKIKLVEDEDEKQEEQKELSYFPHQPRDNEKTRKEKELKRIAFEQFCEANEYISPQRKNHVYKVITQRKLKHMLVHEMQKEFKEFLRNVRIQIEQDIYQEVSDGQITEIMVAVNDTSHHQMTAENFVRT